VSLRQRLAALADADSRLFVVAVLTGVSLLTFPLVAALVQVGGGPFRFGGVDFKAYYLAGLRLRAGLPLYESGPFVEVVPKPRATEYLYPPIVALPFAALTLLPPLPARVVWVGGQLLFLWGSVLALCRGFGVRLSRSEALLVGAAVVGFQPVFFLARIGNVSAAMAGLLCLSAAVTVAPRPVLGDRPYLGGALATLAVLPKPFAAPGGAHLLDDWRRLVGAAATLVAVVGLGLLLFGVDAHRAYVDVLLAGKGWGDGDPTQVPFHARPYYRFPDLAPILRGLVLGVAIAAALLAARLDEAARAFTLGSVAIPLVAPTANTLTLVLAVPGLVVALLLERQEDGRPGVVLASVFAIHWSVYLVRTVGTYGPNNLPGLPWGAVESVLLVQPATLGLLAAFCLYVGQVLARTRDV
jgi:hypothetical protein